MDHKAKPVPINCLLIATVQSRDNFPSPGLDSTYPWALGGLEGLEGLGVQ